MRLAILDANANTGIYNIQFHIPSIGPQTITLTSALPDITDPVVIDGYTQPGSAPATASPNAKPMIELNGAGIEGDGFTITADNYTIKGLIINSFEGSGIYIEESSNHLITDNLIGTDHTGN